MFTTIVSPTDVTTYRHGSSIAVDSTGVEGSSKLQGITKALADNISLGLSL